MNAILVWSSDLNPFKSILVDDQDVHVVISGWLDEFDLFLLE
jgi:hypothetical protein